MLGSAAVGVNGELAGGDLVFVDSLLKELLGQFGAFPGSESIKTARSGTANRLRREWDWWRKP